MRAALLASSLAAIVLWSAAAVAEPGLVVLVRHAEQSAEAGDAGLSAAGQARAEALARALRDLPLGGVLVSSARRARETAAPTAAAQRLVPEVVEVGSDLATHVDAVARRVRERLSSGPVLVVGHSNTLPAIVERLGGPARPALAHCRHDALWLVRLGGKPAFLEARYGAAAEATCVD